MLEAVKLRVQLFQLPSKSTDYDADKNDGDSEPFKSFSMSYTVSRIRKADIFTTTSKTFPPHPEPVKYGRMGGRNTMLGKYYIPIRGN